MTKKRRRVSWVPIEDKFPSLDDNDFLPMNDSANHFDWRHSAKVSSASDVAVNGSALNGSLKQDNRNGQTSEYADRQQQQQVFQPSQSFDRILKQSAYYPLTQNGTATLPHGTPLQPSKSVPTGSFTAASTFLEQKCCVETASLWQRSLESLSVGFYVFGFVFAPLVLTLATLTILFFPPLWGILFIYLCWFIYDYRTPSNGSRPWRRFRQLQVWSHMANYFPMKLIKTAELTADRNYIIGCHPHGILSFGTFLTFCTEAVGFADLFPGLKRRYAVTLPIQYWFPIRRELLMLTNTISSEVTAIEHVLRESERGTVVAIVPGGAAEALDSSPDNFRLTLKKRKGFIKLALKYGANLVPMYTFGETSTYNQIPNPDGSRLRKFQNSLKGLTGITMPFFYGCGFLNRFIGFLPFRTPLYSVVGKPIVVDKVANPTNAQINELHEKYCRELSTLFDAHKHKYGISPQVKLEFV